MPKTKLGSMSVEQLLQFRETLGKNSIVRRRATEPTVEVGR